jgi:lipoprotein-anchoring transpeptidase ErfK/SrfK
MMRVGARAPDGAPVALRVWALGLLACAAWPASSASAAASRFPAAGQLVVPAVAVRSHPDRAAPLVTMLHEFRADYRPQEVLAVSMRSGADGTPWYRVSLAMRPNGTMGWLPAWAVRLAPTKGLIVIRRAARTITVFRQGVPVLRAPVAVGAPGMETPLGRFYVTARFVPVEDPFLGIFALETSAYSRLSEWPGGGIVGIHGTDLPQLLGQAVSHGCIRVSNATAAALKRLAPVGTPIWIRE